MAQNTETTSMMARLRRPVERAAVFALVWWIIAEGQPAGWLFGVPFVGLATAASLKLTPTRAWRVRPLGALRYAGYFAYQSVAGGFDVARRAVSPSMPLDPDIVRYRMRLEVQPAQVLFADTVSLLPGTLSSGLDGHYLTVHVLDRGLPVSESLAAVEERVADVYGVTLSGEPSALEACDLTRGESS